MAKVLFLQDIPYEFVGVGHISAVLKQNNHDCELFAASEEKNIMRKIANYNPNLIAFSTMTGSHKWAIKMAEKIKKELNVPIIFGGAYPTFYPNILENKNIDMICVGEGEYAMLDLVNKLEKGQKTTNIKNIWVKKNGKIIKAASLLKKYNIKFGKMEMSQIIGDV